MVVKNTLTIANVKKNKMIIAIIWPDTKKIYRVIDLHPYDAKKFVLDFKNTSYAKDGFDFCFL